jgi:hypothetical protein
VSNVWQTRYRLLMEQLEAAVDRLVDEVAPTSSLFEQQMPRLLASITALLELHAVNNRGQCKFCGWSRWGWRFWRPRPRCTVFQTIEYAMRQGVDVVWWELLGRQTRLADVRRWVEQRRHVGGKRRS